MRRPASPLRHPLLRLAALLALFAALAGDGDWWRRDWWAGALRTAIDRLNPAPPVADLAAPDCLRALAASGAGWSRLADFATAEGCRVDAAVRVTGLAGAALSAPVVAACPLALALQRHAETVLQPAARELLGSPVARIDHLGSFACRRVRGRPNGPLSQHAFARALDVAGYVTEDGRAVTLAADWTDSTAPPGRFLRRVAARRGPFGTVITPDDDRLHRDHIHFGLRGPIW